MAKMFLLVLLVLLILTDSGPDIWQSEPETLAACHIASEWLLQDPAVLATTCILQIEI